MRILVAYASKRGGTAGLAEAVATRLREADHTVTVAPASTVDDLEMFDAVVLGGALYAERWPWHALRFVQRFLDELRELPVWFFSSGPLDASARQTRIAPTRQVTYWMSRVQARGHVTFGGRLEPTARGLIAAAIVKNGRSGDFRDWQQVNDWADSIATELASCVAAVRGGERLRSMRALRKRAIVLTGLSGILALLGGFELMTLPRTGALLQHPIFPTFFWPGLILAGCVGVANLASAIALTWRSRHASMAAVLSGMMMSALVTVQIIALRDFSTFELSFFAVGLATAAFALRLHRLEPSSARASEKDASKRTPDIGRRTISRQAY